MILPVKQTDIYGGLAEVTGLIRKQESMLVLEYQVKDDVFGMFNSNIRSLELPVHQIDSFQVKKGWYAARYEIHLNRLPAIKKPLHLKENCLAFDIKRKDLEKARSLCSNILLIISEKKLAELDSEYPSDKDSPQPGFSGDKETFSSFRNGGEGLRNVLRDE